jgi:hypothetical protein
MCGYAAAYVHSFCVLCGEACRHVDMPLHTTQHAVEWVASTLHATSEHGVPSITTADSHTSAASSRLN